MSERVRLLIYSPDVVGHPRVYCRAIADALDGQRCEIVFAMGFSKEVGLDDCADLLPLVRREGVRVVDTRSHSEVGCPHLSAEELLGLQVESKCDVVLFIEADKFSDEFRRIASGAAPQLHGRRLGIFARTAEWYPGEDSFTGEPKRVLAPTLRTTLGNIRRLLVRRSLSARYFFEKVILGGRVLDEVLVKDERLASWFGLPVYWMPEISRPAPAQETPGEKEECARRKVELGSFLASNPRREPILYFGDAAYYKGYDLFLKFAVSNPGTCAIHAGQTYDSQQLSFFEHDVEAMRRLLKAEGRLLETASYVHTQSLKELYFGSVRVYLTTHRLALSSSTVIQALELGKPVLVPDRGLLGHRVRANGLGDVYTYGDLDELSRKAKALWESDLTRFEGPTRDFWERFSDEEIRDFFVARLLGSAPGPTGG